MYAMEFLKQRKEFLYKYRDHLDFVLLTENRSVTMDLILETKDLPWNIDAATCQKLATPDGYLERLIQNHTIEDQNEWNYIESVFNPYWTWDDMSPRLDQALSNPKWQDKYGRWFFHNWSRNPAIMKTSEQKVLDSLVKYLAATKIKRTFKAYNTDPTQLICKKRLLREYKSLQGTKTN
jgi:hypothetical protein